LDALSEAGDPDGGLSTTCRAGEDESVSTLLAREFVLLLPLAQAGQSPPERCVASKGAALAQRWLVLVDVMEAAC
jgi:hypothetical protein